MAMRGISAYPTGTHAEACAMYRRFRMVSPIAGATVPPLPNHRIKDLKSFHDVTKEPRQVAGLYFYQLLDCLVELAYQISGDFRRRPQLYRELGHPSIARSLAELNAKYGTEINFLSATERSEIYTPIFGVSDALSQGDTGDFSSLRNDLVRAAKAFAEGADQHSLPMLREAVRTAHQPFRDYLLDLHGDSVRFSKEVALSELTEDICYPILRNQHIAAIFGVAKLAGAEYPYAADRAEDLLMEQVTQQLTTQQPARRIDSLQTYATLTRERISNLQRAALRGAEAIATVIDFRDDANHTDADLDLLVTKCYVWGTALMSLDRRPKQGQSSMQPPVRTAPQPTPGAIGASAAFGFARR
jgi:hypothetical protein